MIERRKNNEDRRSDVRAALAHYQALAAQAEAMAGQDRRIAELTELLRELTPRMPPVNAQCHMGLVAQSECSHCQRIARALLAIAQSEAA